jgi:hypothetical protein
MVSVLKRKLVTALGGCTCVVGVEGREMGCCFGSNGGTEGDAGGRMLVMIFGIRGGVTERRWEAGSEDFFGAGREKDADVGIGAAGVGGALEVDGRGLGLGFSDRSKARPKGDIEGVKLGVKVGALGLSAGVVETVAFRLSTAAFVGKPLTVGEIVVPTEPVSWSGGAFDRGEGGLGFVAPNRGVEPMVSWLVDEEGNVVNEIVEVDAALVGVGTNPFDAAWPNGSGAGGDAAKEWTPCPTPLAIEGAVDDNEGSDIGVDVPLMSKRGASAPNAELDEVVENVPKGDGVPKTFGDVERVEKAEAGLGREEEVVKGTNAEAVGCGPKLDDGHWVASGLKDAGPEDKPSGACSSSPLSTSSMYSAALSSWSCPIPSTVETPSMISDMLKPPRIASMSSIASLPNNRSKMQATKYIMTTLPCSLRTFASLPKICMPSASTTRSEFFLMGALFRWTWSRKSVVSWNTGWEVICSGISSWRSFWSRIWISRW